ncbi:recombinase family protein [Desulfoluna butyratoxydans]|uniref:Dna-binding recombinase domain n=1 Tax=Desulfoluna butyratoxydans TaxID=231438 RepID=A0A4U8YTZ1_9BACT|nr:recombinase family protein [Desulfoluna butyratoxydans]VFQ47354.1 dna-binding recombinase domain [Desulfoluna butyratoxydans]
MSEFLKTVRNTQGRYPGKRGGNYTAGSGYYSQDRRGNERRGQSPRGRDQDNRGYNRQDDLLTPIRQLLEQVTENQRIQEGFLERQTIASEEVAAAFIDIVKILERLTEGAPMPAPQETAAPVSLTQLTDDQLLSPADERREAIKIMKKLRKKGATYKEIAHFLNEKEIPTFSNKGHWHAQTIHRLCNQ